MTGDATNANAPAVNAGAFFIRAVIDVGTNSTKLLVARFGAGDMEVLSDVVTVTRLGGGDGDGKLSPAAMERTTTVIGEMCREARRLGAGTIAAVGTQALRSAGNRGDFIRMVEAVCGVVVRVISGEEEAELSFRAASPFTETLGRAIVFDVGGGSSEIILGRAGSMERRASVPVGALSLQKKFFAETGGGVSSRAINDAARHISGELPREFFDSGPVGRCVGVGGTVITLASVAAFADGRGGAPADGAILSAAELDRQIAMYASMDSVERTRIPGLPRERADIILPGAMIVKSLMNMARRDELAVCGRGLRHGLIEMMAAG